MSGPQQQKVPQHIIEKVKSANKAAGIGGSSGGVFTRKVPLVDGIWKHFTYLALLCVFVQFVVPSTGKFGGPWMFWGVIPGVKAGKSRDLSRRFNFYPLFSTTDMRICCRWRVFHAWKCKTENVACSLEQWIISLLLEKNGWMGMWRAKVFKNLNLSRRETLFLRKYISISESFCPIVDQSPVNYKKIAAEISEDAVVVGMMKSGKCTALTSSEVGVVFKAEGSTK